MKRREANARDLIVDVILSLVRDALDGDAEAIQLLHDEWAPIIERLGLATAEAVRAWCTAPHPPQDEALTLREMGRMLGVDENLVRNYVQGIHQHDPNYRDNGDNHYVDNLVFPARQQGLRGHEQHTYAVPRSQAEWFMRGYTHGRWSPQ